MGKFLLDTKGEWLGLVSRLSMLSVSLVFSPVTTFGSQAWAGTGAPSPISSPLPKTPIPRLWSWSRLELH